MPRKHNTDKQGFSFSETIKQSVWKKAEKVPGYDSQVTRKDRCGAWIDWDKYGDTTENGNGWEIDHKIPVAEGGTDEISNLQPLQWQNNRKKGDKYPAYKYCVVTAK
ncbi:MAG: HNH endonuclease [Saprospiraceae bacterium]|nr:HNH endonuclease [Saprospiraceae bacterium]